MDVRKPLAPASLPGLLVGAALALAPVAALAFPQTLNDWSQRYGAVSASADNAGCQLCHGDRQRRPALERLRMGRAEGPGDGSGLRSRRRRHVTDAEAFFCVEDLNSDNDGSGNNNLDRDPAGTPAGLDPGPLQHALHAATGAPRPAPARRHRPARSRRHRAAPARRPPPPDAEPPDQSAALHPSSSRATRIQAALDRAQPGQTIFVLPGVYREYGDPINGLNITRGLHLVGLVDAAQRVVFENAGNQHNGIVVVPDDRTDCMSCHSSMAPPFPLRAASSPACRCASP